MNPNLLFDFTVNKENKTIHVKREFNAELKLVWKAWTTAEILDQWWGPAPWRAETKLMDFRPGGYWLYAMVSPEGEKHWSRLNYLNIETEKSFTSKDGFSDENGVMNPDFPQNMWENQFIDQKEKTLVSMVLRFDSLEDLETIIAMGFKEGFTAGMNQLDVVLENLKS
ncbi:MAG: SRPBCC domain-containing protein [Moheibacter sp.]